MHGPTLFINNKYLRWYLSIISHARHRNKEVWFEGHHIYPKCFGGTEKNNIVFLTFKEHFLCHWLLTKFTIGRARMKMGYAMTMMLASHFHDRQVKSWQYESARKSSIGYKHSDETKNKMKKNWTPREPWNKGKSGLYSSERLMKIAEARKGKKASKETKEKMSKTRKGISLGPKNEEHKLKLSLANKGKKWFTDGINNLFLSSNIKPPDNYRPGRSRGIE